MKNKEYTNILSSNVVIHLISNAEILDSLVTSVTYDLTKNSIHVPHGRELLVLLYKLKLLVSL